MHGKKFYFPLSRLLQTLKTRKELAHIDVDKLLDFNSNIPTEETLEGEGWEEQIFKNYVANVADEWIEELSGPDRILKLKHVIRE